MGEEPFLWRGSHSYGGLENALLVDPTVGTRTSLQSGFGYTELISNLPSWDNYPPRNNCIMASSKMVTANLYGTAQVMALPDNFRAVITERDMWASFTYIKNATEIHSLDDFDSAFRELIHHISGSKPSSYQDFLKFTKDLSIFLNKLRDIGLTYSTLVSKEHIQKAETILRELDINLHDLRSSHFPNKLLAGIENHVGKGPVSPNDIFNFFNKIFDPNNNNIKLTRDMSTVAHKEWGEVWTDSTCMIIPTNLYDNLKDDVLR